MHRETLWILGKVDDQLTSLCALHWSVARGSFGIQHLVVNAAVKTPRVPIGHEEGTICNPVPTHVNEEVQEQWKATHGSAVANLGRSEYMFDRSSTRSRAIFAEFITSTFILKMRE